MQAKSYFRNDNLLPLQTAPTLTLLLAVHARVDIATSEIPINHHLVRAEIGFPLFGRFFPPSNDGLNTPNPTTSASSVLECRPNLNQTYTHDIPRTRTHHVHAHKPLRATKIKNKAIQKNKFHELYMGIFSVNHSYYFIFCSYDSSAAPTSLAAYTAHTLVKRHRALCPCPFSFLFVFVIYLFICAACTAEDEVDACESAR